MKRKSALLRTAAALAAGLLLAAVAATPAAAQTDVPDEPPAAPTGLHATHVGPTTVTLAWDPVDDGSLAYNIYVNGESLRSSFDETFTEFGLDPETEYTFTVTAFRVYGDEVPFGPESAHSEPFTVSTTTPYTGPVLEAVTGLTVVSRWTDNVILEWTEPQWLNDIRILRDGVEIAVIEHSRRSFVDTGLEPGTEYHYTFTAVPGPGQTAESAFLTATTFGERPDCTATMEVLADWGTGFHAVVTVTNAGGALADGWTVSWSWNKEREVTAHWNAELARTGTAVTASDAGWNAALESGGSTDFGFIAEPSGPGFVPDSIDCDLE